MSQPDNALAVPTAPGSTSSASASGRAGRADEATFAEALQAVDELQSLSSSATGMITSVTDRIEGMLIEELEKTDAEAAEEESQPTDIEAGGASSDPAGYSRLDRSDSVEIFATDWRILYRRCCADAPSRMWDECIAFLAVAPLLLAVLIEAADETQLLLLPVYAFATARLFTLTLEAIARVLLQYRPVFDRVSIMVNGSFGWPSTILVSILLSALFPLLGIDAERWRTIQALPRFWPSCYWLLGAGVSRPIIDVVVKFYINDLTLRHYEHRAREAHQAQTALRAVVAAARSAEREMKGREKRR